jgi:hypothetical protein
VNVSSAKLKTLEAQKNNLAQKTSDLESKTGVESELRKKFMVAGNGEKVLVLVDQKHGTTTSAKVSHKSLWQKFLSLFKS